MTEPCVNRFFRGAEGRVRWVTPTGKDNLRSPRYAKCEVRTANSNPSSDFGLGRLGAEESYPQSERERSERPAP